MVNVRLYASDGTMDLERDDMEIAEVVAEMIASGHWREVAGPDDVERMAAVVSCDVTHEYRALVPRAPPRGGRG